MTVESGALDAPHRLAAAVAAHLTSEELALWMRLRDAADPVARAALFDQHLPYARVVAASFYAKRYHDEIEFDDYLQLASLALVEAMDRFDPYAGVQFRTFAARRMHGAIVDGLERATEKQQQIAARMRIEAQRRASIAGKAESAGPGSTTSADEPVRRQLPEQAMQLVAEAGLAFALSWLLDGTGMIQDAEPTEVIPFYRNVEMRQLRDRIVRLVNSLHPQEQRVIHSHYFQDVSFEQLADRMALTRGRISQIHRSGLMHLKELLRKNLSFDISG